MTKKTSIKKQLEESEFQLPVNPLTPEGREYMRRKRQESIAIYKKYLPNAKTKEDVGKQKMHQRNE